MQCQPTLAAAEIDFEAARELRASWFTSAPARRHIVSSGAPAPLRRLGSADSPPEESAVANTHFTLMNAILGETPVCQGTGETNCTRGCKCYGNGTGDSDARDEHEGAYSSQHWGNDARHPADKLPVDLRSGTNGNF